MGRPTTGTNFQLCICRGEELRALPFTAAKDGVEKRPRNQACWRSATGVEMNRPM